VARDGDLGAAGDAADDGMKETFFCFSDQDLSLSVCVLSLFCYIPHSVHPL